MFDFMTAEASTVGCFLIDARCFPTIRESIPSPDAFASDPCRKAFAAACKLADGGQPIDPVTAGRTAGLDNGFLVQCMELVPSCTGAAQYAQTVTEGFQRRQLRELGDKLQADSLSLGTDTTRLLTDAWAALDGLSEASGSNAASSSFDSLRDFLSFRAEVNEGRHKTVKTGFPSLDGILGGFAQGGLYVIAARPGVGKSALGAAMADMMARENTVLYASLEMSADELNARRVAAFSPAPCTFGKLLFGKTTEAEDAAVIAACGALAERKLHILAVPSLTVAATGNSGAERPRSSGHGGLFGASVRRRQKSKRIRTHHPDFRRPEKACQAFELRGYRSLPAQPGIRHRQRRHPPQALTASVIRCNRARCRRRFAPASPRIRTK